MVNKEKFVNPFTDYGFKRLFGEEYNKDLLLDFLNELLQDRHGTLRDLQYLRSDRLGNVSHDRRAIFDLYCESERGEKFIVEIQKAKQNFFKDRMVYYSTFPIQEQAEMGSQWNFQLKAVYMIGILDFIFEEDEKEPYRFRYDVKHVDIHTNKVFYDKLTYIYLEMPKFNKTLEQLQSRFEKWLFVLKNLSLLDRIPEKLQEKVFEKLFSAAEIAKFSRQERNEYEESLKVYRDIQNTLDTARAEGKIEGKIEGRIEGKIEGKIEVVLTMLDGGFDVATISKATGLKKDEIDKIKKRKKS